MKKYQIFLTLTVLAIIAAAIVCLTLLFQSTKKTESNDPAPFVPRQTQGQVNFTSKPSASQENSETPSFVSAPTTYTIREYLGHIGVFENDSPTPFQEIDVLVSTLPPSDRALLTKGITTEHKAQLRSLLEDYAS